MSTPNIAPCGALPTERQINHLKKYSKKAFFHFGVNTFSGVEWGDGTEMESIFNPSEADVRQWIKTAKEAGLTLAILTAKHHDGFCLWPSKYTKHSVKNSPYKNGNGDIVREFADACREEGIAMGVYLSPWDRHSEYWGSPEYSNFYNLQLTELLTQYGEILEVWWDGAGSTEAAYDWNLWTDTVRKYQPNALIFGPSFPESVSCIDLRWIGNEAGRGVDPHYLTVNPEDEENYFRGHLGGERFIISEVDTSVRPGWFYHKAYDKQVKDTDKLIDLWFNSIGVSSTMLLNFPPDKRGLVFETDAKNAIDAHKIIEKVLSKNFAQNASVKANSVRDGFPAENIINGNYDDVYVPEEGVLNPVIEITLEKEEIFDTLLLGEYIELGVRVGGFTAEAFIDGKWTLLADKKSIGYKKAIYFSPVTSDRIRITITEAMAEPVLREFGLYNLTCEGYIQNKPRKILGEEWDLVHDRPNTRVKNDADGITVELNGICPFNRLRFNGTGIDKYELQVFDGEKYVPYLSGENPSEEETIDLKETITHAYQFRFITGKSDNENLNLRVYEMER